MTPATALINFDESIFFFINNLPHTIALDQLFLFFSFYPLIIWIIIGSIVFVIEERREKIFALRLILALFLAGGLVSGIIKPVIRRPRPDISHKEAVIVVTEKPAVVSWANDFAFPPGHSAIAFAGAYIVTREETQSKHGKKHSKGRKKLIRFLLMTFACLTAFSRIYLGKHYPLDVIAGSGIGWMMGWVSWKMVDLLKMQKH